MNSKLAIATFSLLLLACGEGGGGSGVDANSSAFDGGPLFDAGPNTSDAGSTAADAGNSESELHSTLVSDCGAQLQGRAIVNFNGNLGISFTESDGAFSFLGSIQFELPAGFTGLVPNPENWDGQSERHIVATTNSNFTLHGNHCWLDGPPSNPGSVTILEYRPSEGIVRARLNALQLKSCVSDTVCTLSGEIETTATGVFQ